MKGVQYIDLHLDTVIEQWARLNLKRYKESVTAEWFIDVVKNRIVYKWYVTEDDDE